MRTCWKTVAFPNIELRISAQGEILSRGPSLFMGYYKKPDATAAAVRDGWLHTGDAGRIDENGELTVLDRLKDVMRLADGIPGAILGGLLIGTLQNLASGYLDPCVGNGLKCVFPFFVLVAILLLKPYGLFGRVRIERV